MRNRDRILKAVDYVEAHLGADLKAAHVGAEQGLSSWHFQRLFHAVVGNAFKEYVRRRRLTLAVTALVETERRVIEIALDSGFETQESFSRAFKTMFGLAPGECRRIGGGRALGLAKPRFDPSSTASKGAPAVEPTITTMPERHYAGLGTNFISILSPDANAQQLIPALWHRFIARRGELKGAVGNTDYGLCNVIPEGAPRTHEDEFYYVACTEIADPADVPPGMEAFTVEAGEYAVFTHEGSLAGLEQTIRGIYGGWIPDSGCTLRSSSPDVKIYGPEFAPDSADSKMQIAIPIRSE